MRTFRRLVGFLRPYRAGVAWSFALAFGALAMTVLIPYLTGRAIDGIRSHHRHALTMWAIAIAAAGLARLGLSVSRRLVAGRVSLEPGDSLVVFSDGLLDLRPDLATKEVQLPYEARRAGTAQEMVDILAHGGRDKELFDDVTVLALRRL